MSLSQFDDEGPSAQFDDNCTFASAPTPAAFLDELRVVKIYGRSLRNFAAGHDPSNLDFADFTSTEQHTHS